MRLASVISRAEAMIPSICPEAPRSGLAVARNKRISPSLRSVRYSMMPLVRWPESTASKNARTSLRSRGSMRSPRNLPTISSGEKPSRSFDQRTDESIAALAIQRDDQVGEAFDEPPRKFLLPVQALLDCPALGNVHQGSLMPADTSSGVANEGGGMQAGDRGAVAAAERDLMAADGPGERELALCGLPLRRLEQEIRERTIEHVLALFVAKHSREGRIEHFSNLPSAVAR